MTWAAIVATGCLEVPDRSSPVDAGPDDVRLEDGRPPDMPLEADEGPPPDGEVMADATVDPDAATIPDGAVAVDMALEMDGPPAVVFDMAPMADIGPEPDVAVEPDVGEEPDAGEPIDRGLPPDMAMLEDIQLAFRVEGDLVEAVDFGEARVDPAGAEQTVVVQIENLGPGAADYLDEALVLQVRSGGAVRTDTRLLGDLAEGGTVNIRLRWDPQPGLLDATLSVSTNRGTFAIDLTGLAWQPVHILGTANGGVIVDGDLGQEPLVPMGNFGGRPIADIACGGRCTELEADEQADAVCVLGFGEVGNRDSTIRVSEDGVNWEDGTVGGLILGPIRGVDYGPPWAATDGTYVITSPDGLRWQNRGELPNDDPDRGIGEVVDIAVSDDGRVVVVADNGFFWSFLADDDQAIPIARATGGVRDIRRIEFGRFEPAERGVFLAVGARGAFVQIDGNGGMANALEPEIEGPNFLDVARDAVGRSNNWLASDGVQLWQSASPQGGWDLLAEDTPITRFAVAEHGIMGATVDNEVVAVPFNDGRGGVRPAEATFISVAAGRLCPTGHLDD